MVVAEMRGNMAPNCGYPADMLPAACRGISAQPSIAAPSVPRMHPILLMIPIPDHAAAAYSSSSPASASPAGTPSGAAASAA